MMAKIGGEKVYIFSISVPVVMVDASEYESRYRAHGIVCMSVVTGG